LIGWSARAVAASNRSVSDRGEVKDGGGLGEMCPDCLAELRELVGLRERDMVLDRIPFDEQQVGARFLDSSAN
jgi:hypothetical protein